MQGIVAQIYEFIASIQTRWVGQGTVVRASIRRRRKNADRQPDLRNLRLRFQKMVRDMFVPLS
jgi:hypothetical protein